MNRPKKVLVVTSRLPFETGGNLLIASSLVRKLKETGYDSSLFTVPQNRFGRQASAYLSARLTDVGRTYLDEEIDQVISFRFPSFAVKHPRHVCWLNHRMREYYDLWEKFYSGIKSPFNKLKETARKALIHKVDKYLLTKNITKLFAQSKNIQQRLLKYGGIRSEVLYPPPSGSFDYRSESYDDFILSPSRLNPLKRNSMLIRAFSKIEASGLKCYIAGEGDERGELERLIEDLNLNDRVRLLGNLKPDELTTYFSRSLAVFFGPYDEDYRLVTLEAMMCKKPVITFTDSGGPTELVRDDVNGYIIEPEEDALADKINFLYNNKGKAESLGSAGYELATEITWEKTFESLMII